MVMYTQSCSTRAEFHLGSLLMLSFQAYTVEPLHEDTLKWGHLFNQDTVCGPS